MSERTVQQQWTLIDEWLQQNVPQARAVLRPGMDPATLAKSSRGKFGALEEGLQEHLACHDGQEFAEPFLIGTGQLLSREQIIETHTLWMTLSGGSDPTAQWEKDWQPFVDRDGDCLFVRGDHTVWLYLHETDAQVPVSDSIADWLAAWLQDLRSGVLAWQDEVSFIYSDDAASLSWPLPALSDS